MTEYQSRVRQVGRTEGWRLGDQIQVHFSNEAHRIEIQSSNLGYEAEYKKQVKLRQNNQNIDIHPAQINRKR